MTNTTNLTTSLDPVQGLVDYVLDIKPYHTKIIEILIEYIYTDNVQVSIKDLLHTKICMNYPASTLPCSSSDPAEDLLYCGGFGVSSFGSTGVIPIYSPDPTKSIQQYPVFDPITKTYIVPDNQLGLFPIGSKFMVYAIVVDSLGNNIDADIHYGVYTVKSASFNYGKIPTRSISTNSGTLDFGVEPHTLVSVEEDNFIISSIPAINTFRITGNHTQYFIPGDQIGITSTNNPLNTPSTISTSQYFSVGDYTEVVLNAGFTTPLLNDTVSVSLRTLPIGQTYTLYIVPLSLQIENVIPYSLPTIQTPNESAYLDIGSNAFVIDSNHIALFQQGTRFEVFNSTGNNRVYTTLYSDYVGGKTRIRPLESIQDLTGDGMIKPFHVDGFSVSADFCAKVPETTVLVKFDENIKFIGMGMNFTDNVVLYNMENRDVYGYEIPYGTIISNTTPIIALIEPVAPALFDLWFDGNQLYRRDGEHWVPITTVFWIKTDIAGRYTELYRLTKTVLVDTGWEQQDFNAINGVVLALPTMTPFGSGFFGDPETANPLGPLKIDIHDSINDVVNGNIIDAISADHTVIFDSNGITIPSPSESLAATSIIDTLEFGWAGPVTWFQYNIMFMDSTAQTITVYGNALGDVQLGETIRVITRTANSGQYQIISSPIYNSIDNRTILPVSGITIDSFGGVIESLEDFGMHLRLYDTVGVQTLEEVDAIMPATGMSMVGSFDTGAFDIGAFDESLDTITPLYKG